MVIDAITKFSAPGTLVSRLPVDLDETHTQSGFLVSFARDLRRRVGDMRYSRSAIGRSSLVTLDRLRGSENGQTGLIVASGPSLRRTDLSVLDRHPYILMNRGYVLMDSYERAPSLICAHDPDVLKHFGAELAALPVPLMVSRDAADLFDRRENVAFLRYQLRWRFAKHLGLSSHHGYTAMFWALQGAYLLGWQKAVIIGMDHNHSSAGAPSAYETTGQVDTNHFDPRYFPQGLSLRNPVLRGNEYSYALARAAWDRAGRDVVDCTIDGKCDIFRKSELAIELGR